MNNYFLIGLMLGLILGASIIVVTLLVFSIISPDAFSLTEEERDEKEHEEWAKENYPKMSYNNSQSTILVCGPVHKLMEQWLTPNEYKCHKA